MCFIGWGSSHSWGVALIALLMCGCEKVFATPEERINAAIPLSQELIHSIQRMREYAPSVPVKGLEEELSRQLKMRARSCAHGYLPPWYAAVATIRDQLASQPCFAQSDKENAKWLDLRVVAVLLAQPPLRPLPVKPLTYYAADDFINRAHFAEKAGVVLLESKDKLQLIDLENGQVISQVPKTQFRHASLSPNGRVIVMGHGVGSQLRDSQTGEVLTDLPEARPFGFAWIDTELGLYNGNEANGGRERAVLIDFASGKESLFKEMEGSVDGIASVPSGRARFIAASYGKVALLELLKSDGGAGVKILQEERLAGVMWGSNNSGKTSDGTYYFSVADDLYLVSTSTLEQTTIEFGNFYLQEAIPTPDPDKVLLTGFMPNGSYKSVRNVLFSIGHRTVTPIDHMQFVQGRFQYVPSLNRFCTIERSKVLFLENLPLGGTVALADFSADPSVAKLSTDRVEAAQSRQQSAVVELAKDAQVEAVGVYEGADGVHGHGKERQAGNVEVKIRRSATPLVVVLSSYEPVVWKLQIETGAKVTAILLSSYYPSSVVGAGDTRVIVVGSNYAYEGGSSEFGALDNDIFRLTGKRISIFQGSYKGSSFSVGGL